MFIVFSHVFLTTPILLATPRGCFWRRRYNLRRQYEFFGNADTFCDANTFSKCCLPLVTLTIRQNCVFYSGAPFYYLSASRIPPGQALAEVLVAHCRQVASCRANCILWWAKRLPRRHSHLKGWPFILLRRCSVNPCILSCKTLAPHTTTSCVTVLWVSMLTEKANESAIAKLEPKIGTTIWYQQKYFLHLKGIWKACELYCFCFFWCCQRPRTH